MIPCRRLVEAPVTALDERKEPLRRPQGRPERIIVLSVRADRSQRGS
ncbi:hypothetical protein SAMN02745177_00123 [Desulforamulus hydrothermalis Lam5 = DSM 18033]|nr:hypothetical protein SAMN02745177_00123 [Desulforamulus hydrothermalis Lam5 = DSM 18033]